MFMTKKGILEKTSELPTSCQLLSDSSPEGSVPHVDSRATALVCLSPRHVVEIIKCFKQIMTEIKKIY